MASYFVRRIFYSIGLLIVSASAIFFIVHALPGSPYDRWLREMAERNPSTKPLPFSNIERLNLVLGLDRPLPEQYAAWIKGVFTCNFGESWSIGKGSPVFEVIRSRLLVVVDPKNWTPS
jgi:ABC-type dipeptide/oligopeptide/nickel transport system permease component